jgi:hypothetical protein
LEINPSEYHKLNPLNELINEESVNKAVESNHVELEEYNI